MCGIAGFVSASVRDAQQLSAIATAMSSRLVSRGPDDSGVWTDATAGVAFGFRRLSIIDLSALGHQPMVSESGRYVIEFNGEIYNYLDLRNDLQSKGHRFRGHSDTEVLLAAFTEWGIESSIRRCNGMFAFALWDRTERRLWLGRDRLGKKPLYYGFSGSTLLWGSELKALAAHPDFNRPLDRSAIAMFLQFGYIPAPHSIYEGIRKLPAATLISFVAGSQNLPEPKPYWSALDAAVAAQHDRFTGTFQAAVEELDQLLRDAVRIRMIADVPLGAFLSGGIDSSTVVALMQAQSNLPVRTFSIGFAPDEFNEAKYAKDVAQHLGTDHTEMYVSAEEALRVVPSLPSIYDEPFADSSQIPTYLVSKLARTQVTVALSGDGGDEVFGGYDRYFVARQLWGYLRLIPSGARSATAAMLRTRLLSMGASSVRSLMPKALRANPADKLRKLADVVAVRSGEELYGRLMSCWKEPLTLVRGVTAPHSAGDPMSANAISGFVERMMATDTVTYLPDDILVKVDRASMAVSLECRAPILDYRVYEYAWRLPLAYKIQGQKGKRILREVLKRYVPESMFERPKMGFGVPLASWLRGALRDWAEALLNRERIEEEGFLNSAPIRAKWEEHLRGERDWHYYLWTVLMFQAWLEHIREERSADAAPERLFARTGSR